VLTAPGERMLAIMKEGVFVRNELGS